MILDWIYNTPTWLWGTVVVITLDAAACIGLVIFHRLVHLEVRRAHNELTGFTVAVISVTYAVLLAFIAIATWESFTSSEGIVDREADCVGSIYRDTQGLPPAMGQEIRSDVRRYTDTVIHQEWPVQQTGNIPSKGWGAAAQNSQRDRHDAPGQPWRGGDRGRAAQDPEHAL